MDVLVDNAIKEYEEEKAETGNKDKIVNNENKTNIDIQRENDVWLVDFLRYMKIPVTKQNKDEIKGILIDKTEAIARTYRFENETLRNFLWAIVSNEKKLQNKMRVSDKSPKKNSTASEASDETNFSVKKYLKDFIDDLLNEKEINNPQNTIIERYDDFNKKCKNCYLNSNAIPKNCLTCSTYSPQKSITNEYVLKSLPDFKKSVIDEFLPQLENYSAILKHKDIHGIVEKFKLIYNKINSAGPLERLLPLQIKIIHLFYRFGTPEDSIFLLLESNPLKIDKGTYVDNRKKINIFLFPDYDLFNFIKKVIPSAGSGEKLNVSFSKLKAAYLALVGDNNENKEIKKWKIQIKEYLEARKELLQNIIEVHKEDTYKNTNEQILNPFLRLVKKNIGLYDALVFFLDIDTLNFFKCKEFLDQLIPDENCNVLASLKLIDLKNGKF